eukprot:EG_transcript_14985
MSLPGVLRHFPPTRFAIAYGSGVFAQRGNVPSMVDLIFAVDDAEEWHRENLTVNAHHYSVLRHAGPQWIACLQQTAARMWFNPNVRIGEQAYKYGVISTRDLMTDLVDWQYLYASGRMQKPVRVLQPDPEVDLCNQSNLRSAMAVALLSLGPCFTEAELYHEITQLSYRGDIRMSIGEDPKKTFKIVEGSFPDFQTYYADVLRSAPFSGVVGGAGAKPSLWEQDVGVEATNALILQLPPPLLALLTQVSAEESFDAGLQAVRQARQRIIHRRLQSIVRRISVTQTCKGLLTAGVSRSWTYALRKLKIGAGK